MLRLGVGWANLHLLALDQIDGRVEDHLIAVPDAVAHLDLFSQITRDRDFPQVNDAIFDHGAYLTHVPEIFERLEALRG